MAYRTDCQARSVYLWNTETLDYEVATTGTGTGQYVSVQNFPAVISGSEVPVSLNNPQDIDPTAFYKISDIDSSGDPAYYGYVKADGGWYIMRYSESSGQARYVKGSADYSTNWTNRASLSYSRFDEVF